MPHLISLDKAIEMTKFFRQERELILEKSERGKDLLPYSETFDVTAVAALLAQPGCVKMRIYYGMCQDKKVHAIIVGADVNDNDILPVTALQLTGSVILEESIRCPVNCPPVSQLNSD